ncbi:thiol reductant ABC exporter subunit CydD [Pseudonocardia sp.]|jgi:thiol reductant ABC exporter CydD subunit|uniref:thiol reductant ABC exporter subunit CydD n=1 Tax=Pseudonocardia sp. TaxID=60912 RepID=UPI00262A0C4B|nr:thiol reductant ABC exporter subunit CydD [Pseudonocardia sp.]MCW2718743.1 transporter, CydDC cysteine exporter (CydDC-E) family, permease/ATP-binding protein CydD [Pseudonocardia sp.]MDT7613426.1 ATP-binding cassette, subfamily bacterial CydD [Pseudonocardiales bacterium]
MRPLDPRLLTHARAARGYLGLCVVLGTATAGLLIGQALLLAAAISGAFLSGLGLAALRTPLLLLAATAVARALLDWGQDVAGQRAAASVKSQLRSGLLEHAVRLGPGWVSGERSGELALLAVRGLDGLDGYIARYLPALVLAVIVPGAVLAALLGTDLTAGVTVALTLPLVPVFLVLVGQATQQRTDRQWRALSVLAGHFLDVVTGLPTLKVFGRARAQAETIRTVTDDHTRATMSTLRVAFLSALVLELVSTLSVALVAVGVGLRLVTGTLGLEPALAVLILAPEAYRPLRQLGVHHHAIAEGMGAASEAIDVLETPVPQEGGRYPVPDVARSTVLLDAVTVRYPGRGAPALADVSLEIRPGETVAVVGPSGCGKSTLATLLVGVVRPERGRVTVAGVDLAELDIGCWRRQLAHLPQHPRLLAGTIAENVRLADPAAPACAVRRALYAAGADFVDRLDRGMDTVLGEQGAGLSAGQRQRVALARVLLTAAPLLVLDEPTSGLDATSEHAVAEALCAEIATRTVVLITHRPALLELADRVVHLDRIAVPT